MLPVTPGSKVAVYVVLAADADDPSVTFRSVNVVAA
jgi:hypothetical protein